MLQCRGFVGVELPANAKLSCLPFVLRRQLGIKLHGLGNELPIYDAALGRKADPQVDTEVERWASD